MHIYTISVRFPLYKQGRFRYMQMQVPGTLPTKYSLLSYAMPHIQLPLRENAKPGTELNRKGCYARCCNLCRMQQGVHTDCQIATDILLLAMADVAQVLQQRVSSGSIVAM